MSDHTAFRFLAFENKTGEYAHFGYSKEMALVRAESDLNASRDDFTVIDLGDRKDSYDILVEAERQRIFLDDVKKIGTVV